MLQKIKSFGVSTSAKITGAVIGVSLSTYSAFAEMATSSINTLASTMAQGIWDIIIAVYPTVFITLLPLIALYKVFTWASSKF